MARALSSLVAGILFGVGLALSGMVNPAKVIGFMNLAGPWDPTLALVMGGALAVTLPAFHWVLRRPRPVLAERFVLPTRKDLDPRLIGGAALFGIGWGLTGLCPGAAIAATVSGLPLLLGALAAMLLGLLLWQSWSRTRGRVSPRKELSQAAPRG